uniref:Uncharacterized protein n=1 Tax=Wuchereria bancrofti TaxID=6293 RepID=A0AAF5Q3N8_WUCBA
MTYFHSRSKTERLLRYILRRQQCVIMLFMQIIFLILIITVIFAQFHSTANLNEKYLRLIRENDILAQYANFSNFFSCKYYPPTEYDVSECGWGSDESSFMIRFHRRRTGTHKCASRLDMIPCDLKYPKSYKQWQNALKMTANTSDFVSEYRPCPGIFNNSIGKYGISPQTSILAPTIRNIDQFGKGFMLRPKDFIMRCPICMISSKFSSNMRKNYCARSMETLREGWPQKAALCDEIENHPFQQFCNTYDAIMHKMHDITAPIINSEANYDQDID